MARPREKKRLSSGLTQYPERPDSGPVWALGTRRLSCAPGKSRSPLPGGTRGPALLR